MDHWEPAHASPAGEQVTVVDRALARDGRAAARDLAAEERDLRASHRDREGRAASSDADPDVARHHAAVDRDAAAGDRADALADRQADRADRAAALDRGSAPAPRTLDEHAAFRQAQGVLMATCGMSAPQASAELMAAAHWERDPLRDLVQQVVRDGWLEPAHDGE